MRLVLPKCLEDPEMEREIAEKLMKVLLEFDDPFNRATEIISQVSSQEEQRALRRGLVESVGKVYSNVMYPILRQYPDLDPDKGQKSEKSGSELN